MSVHPTQQSIIPSGFQFIFAQPKCLIFAPPIYIISALFLDLILQDQTFHKFTQNFQRKAGEKQAEELRLQGVELFKVEK